ncbi:hypothetical protein [Ruegeria lacuscaerulensis]|uniref:hypothetical protein n=1 Tax=Ruegeria lacuscaerulensis TaxID=55218 RepID=UPI00147A1CCC|nr:hypothetical protein [Ruegeria lacuscaerulensis]
MSESLLNFSEVLLFGRLLHDLKIRKSKANPDETVRLATKAKVPLDTNQVVKTDLIDGEEVVDTNDVLVMGYGPKKSGIYKVEVQADPTKYKLINRTTVAEGSIVEVEEGNKFEDTFWEQTEDISGGGVDKQRFKFRKNLTEQLGDNAQLKKQYGANPRLARIYGFAYEGTYYDLPEPTVFLVHGKGESATDRNNPGKLASRAPNDPSLSGVAAADYQIANDIRVWNYDKADYTIRMDVTTGMFEQVLLDIYFGFDSPAISGAKVSGAKVSGAKVSGAKVSGAKVSGAKVSGAKARGGD